MTHIMTDVIRALSIPPRRFETTSDGRPIQNSKHKQVMEFPVKRCLVHPIPEDSKKASPPVSWATWGGK